MTLQISPYFYFEICESQGVVAFGGGDGGAGGRLGAEGARGGAPPGTQLPKNLGRGGSPYPGNSEGRTALVRRPILEETESVRR